jgi:NAD(P)-dependent dehydrogenase (short-subunit alcohol dehydrogenase family)
MLQQTFDSAPSAEAREQLRTVFLQRHPLGRFGQADEVAEAIAFLASAQASYITGVALPVDGGRLA